jgi:hypothetical protein
MQQDPEGGGSAPPAEDGAAEDGAVDSSAPSDPFSVFASCAPNPSSGDFPADVAAVLRDKCQTCHRNPPINHAPFPLLAYGDTQRSDPDTPYVGKPIWQVMHVVIQLRGVPHMPFGNAPQLTTAQFQTLDGWLTACAMPAGAANDAAAE